MAGFSISVKQLAFKNVEITLKWEEKEDAPHLKHICESFVGHSFHKQLFQKLRLKFVQVKLTYINNNNNSCTTFFFTVYLVRSFKHLILLS